MRTADRKYQIRPLNDDDLERVIDIDRQYVDRRRDGFYSKRLEAALTDPAGFVYLGCEKDGDLMGFLLARLQEGDYGTTGCYAELDAIGVDKDTNGKGVGRSLMTALDEILEHKGIGQIRSQAEWRNLSMLGFFAASDFSLASRSILERDATYLSDFAFAEDMVEEATRLGDAQDYSDEQGDERGALTREIVPCRPLRETDLAAIVKIDRKVTGADHRAYYERKISEAFSESGVRVSLVAEQDDHVVGFAMARVDFGEFDRIEPAAVLDSIAVDPDYAHHLVGTVLLSQLLANLVTLQIEVVRSETDANHFGVRRFLQRNGFTASQRLSFVRKVN